jgi:ubiquinone/menaquinone biosynthesis C-methylase UbiE
MIYALKNLLKIAFRNDMNHLLEPSLQATQASILKHHGGNSFNARQMITNSYDSRHDRAFWQFWQTQVATHYQPGDGIMDFGAGIGQFVRDCAVRYPTSPVYGLEAAPYMLDKPLELPSNGHLLVDDLNYPQNACATVVPNSVAMIMANMVVHELTQPIKMFKAAYQWLKPGGRLCVIDSVRQPLANYLQQRYTPEQLWSPNTGVAELEDAFEDFLEHNRYHPEDLEFMLTAGGFKLIERLTFRQDRFVRIVVEKA